MKKCIIILLALGLVFGGTVYGKMNKVRECEVVAVNCDEIVIQHPNGNLYSFYAETDNEFTQGEKIKVVFDEFYEWESEYIVKNIK